jgi:hypothetical protein
MEQGKEERRMKLLKILSALALVLILAPGLLADRYERDFLATAVDCALSTTVVNGTDFTSRELSIPDDVLFVGITCTFTRTTGSAEEVDFKLQYSYDEGTTWTTEASPTETFTFSTNIEAVTNVATVYTVVLCPGVTHVRLSEIDNRDTTINLTACNATMSYKR